MAAHQAPQAMGFSRQKYRSGVPLPSPWQEWENQIFFGSFLWDKLERLKDTLSYKNEPPKT